jgi:TRAP-type C4-dicarboxylate transport system substrate-binding protein
MNTRRWNRLPDEIKAAFGRVNKEMPAWAFRHAIDYNNKTNNFIATKFKTHYFLTEEENEMWNKPFQGFVKNKAIKVLGKPAEELWGKIMNAANEMKDLRAKNQEPVFH